MTAWWQHTLFKPATLLLSQKKSFLEAGGQGRPRYHHSVPDLPWQHGGSMLSPVSNTVILQCFDAVGWVTGRAFGL